MIQLSKIILASTLLSLAGMAYADITIPMQLASNGKSIGDVVATDTSFGLLLTPNLRDLPPGPHGFHIHANPSCADIAQAAGGHLDPDNSNKHLGPYNTTGHLGDLAVLIVNADGTANLPVLAPRLTTKLIRDRSLMIHEGGDNYSDKPLPLGGGGKRLACGIIQ